MQQLIDGRRLLPGRQRLPFKSDGPRPQRRKRHHHAAKDSGSQVSFSNSVTFGLSEICSKDIINNNFLVFKV